MRPAVAAGFVFPCDRDSLQLALSGAFAGFMTPILIGPEARIRDAAAHAGLDISRIPVANTEDAPRAAAVRAVELARNGEVGALVKGTLGNEDLLAPIAATDSGLRTDRRLSHAYFLDLPGRSQGLLFADAVLNITPTLAAKKDILLNTLELAAAIGISAPHAAILAALGAVNHAFPSTVDAAALKAMATEGLFADAIVDGPLTVDGALGANAAQLNAGSGKATRQPDVLIAPSMEAACLLLQALTVVTGGFAAGIVLGARVAVVAPARTDSMEVRMASCVLAALHAARALSTAKPAHLAIAPTVAIAAGHATA